MKRFLAVLIAAWCPLAGAADLTITYPDNVTPQQRGAVAKAVLGAVPAGSKVQLAAGDNELADAGGTCTRVPAIEFRGAGRGQTIIRSRANNQLMCQLELSHLSDVWDMSVINDCPLGSAGVCIGFSQATTARGSAAGIHNCEIISHGEYGLYNWSADGNTIFVDNCEIISKNGAVAGRGSGAQGCYLVFRKSKVTGDIRIGQTGGDSGTQVFGCWVRGGRVTAHDSDFISRANAEPYSVNKLVVNRQAAVFVGLGDTRNVGLQTWATFEGHNCRFLVASFPGCTQADLIEEGTRQPGSVVVFGGKGSGVDGAITTKGNVQVIR